MQEVSTRKIYQYYSGQGFAEKEDLIINEHMFELFVNDEYYTTHYCTPSLLEELIIGNLAMNNLINQASQLTFEDKKANCIKVKLNEQLTLNNRDNDGGEPQIKAEQILDLMNKHLDSSPLHKSTGGTHVMSLANNHEIIFSCQDIGRHNALDKLYGYCLKNNIALSDKVLLSSGRVTNEMCQKAIEMGIKLFVSRATVSSLAIELAEKHGLTVIGFTRVNRFNIYTHPHRILE